MKQYSTKSYYAYAKKLLEGDVVVESKPLDPKLKVLIAGASVGGVGALAYLAYIKNVFKIDTWQSLATSIRNYAGLAEGDSVIKALFVGLGKSISGAISWASNLVKPLIEKAGLNNTIGSSSYTYGAVLGLAAVAAAIGFVLVKVYKVLKNKRATLESVSEFKTAQRKNIKKAFNECNAMFSKLNKLVEGDAPVDTAAAEGIIAKSWDGLKKIFDSAWDLAKGNYRIIALMIAIVTGCVACWYGVKKYRASKAAEASSELA